MSHGGYSNYGGGDGNSLSMGSQGYGGYGQKQEDSGIIGNTVSAIGNVAGTVAGGVGHYLSSGISYIGSFRGGQ